MPMSSATNQTGIGEQLYFFQSPNAQDHRCMIIAHGGKLRGDGDFACNGVTVQFFVADGQALRSNVSRLMIETRNGGTVAPLGAETRGPNGRCPDYSLAKYVGKHGDPYKSTYQDMQNNMGLHAGLSNNLCPHFVSIRNRSVFGKGGKLIKLSQVIQQVTAVHAHITEFWVGACRGHNDGYLTKISATLWGG